MERTPDETFLASLRKVWLDYKRSLQMVRDILMYMDRTYVKMNKKRPVYEMGLAIFCQHCARTARVRERILNMLLQLVQAERNGDMVDRSLIRAIALMLKDMGEEVAPAPCPPARPPPQTARGSRRRICSFVREAPTAAAGVCRFSRRTSSSRLRRHPSSTTWCDLPPLLPAASAPPASCPHSPPPLQPVPATAWRDRQASKRGEGPGRGAGARRGLHADGPGWPG